MSGPANLHMKARPDGARENPAAVARDPAVLHLQPDEAWVVPAGALRLERVPSQEGTVPLDDPGPVHLEGRLPPVEVLAREEVPFLEPQGVPGPEPHQR